MYLTLRLLTPTTKNCNKAFLRFDLKGKLNELNSVFSDFAGFRAESGFVGWRKRKETKIHS